MLRSFSQRLDAFQRKHNSVGFPIGVVYKFGDDQGNYLAVLITYYAFIGIFPLLLLASSILGFVLQGNEELQHEILDSALGQFPIIGDQFRQPGGLKGSTTAVIIGALGALYGALGVAQATQNALNIAWAVPRNKRPNPLLARVRSLGLLTLAAAAILATTFLSTLGSDVDALNTNLSTTVQVLRSIGVVFLNAGVFMLVYRLATTHAHSIWRTIPGALFAAVSWQLLQLFGTAYVGHVIKPANGMNSVFALVLGLVAWIYLGAVAIIIGAELNVVKAHRLYPRALLTPFTDNVDLTAADLRAYADYAEATRSKGFQSVDVRWEHDGQYATARKQARSAALAAGADDPNAAEPADELDTQTRGEKPHKHH